MGMSAARGSSEARDFTPERTPRHSILDVPVSVRRGNNRYGEGTRPRPGGLLSDRYGRF